MSLAVPAGQGTQMVELSGNRDPGGQLVHSVWLGDGVVPAGQVRQEASAVMVPCGQESQEIRSDVGILPDSQGKQATAASLTPVYVPPGQLEHEVEPSLVATVPRAQAAHETPAVPRIQGTHSTLPVPKWGVLEPAGQGSQRLRS